MVRLKRGLPSGSLGSTLLRPVWPRAGSSSSARPWRTFRGRGFALFTIRAGRSQAEGSCCSWVELVLTIILSRTESRSRAAWKKKKIPPHLFKEVEVHTGSHPSSDSGRGSALCPPGLRRGLRQDLALSFFSIWQHQIQVPMQGARQAWGHPPAAFGGTPRAWRERRLLGRAARKLAAWGRGRRSVCGRGGN
jgi:hypothetical protein